jgi:hypothetical protein
LRYRDVFHSRHPLFITCFPSATLYSLYSFCFSLFLVDLRFPFLFVAIFFFHVFPPLWIPAIFLCRLEQWSSSGEAAVAATADGNDAEGNAGVPGAPHGEDGLHDVLLAGLQQGQIIGIKPLTERYMAGYMQHQQNISKTSWLPLSKEEMFTPFVIKKVVLICLSNLKRRDVLLKIKALLTNIFASWHVICSTNRTFLNVFQVSKLPNIQYVRHFS